MSALMIVDMDVVTITRTKQTAAQSRGEGKRTITVISGMCVWECTVHVSGSVCVRMFMWAGYLQCCTSVSDKDRNSKLEGGRH